MQRVSSKTSLVNIGSEAPTADPSSMMVSDRSTEFEVQAMVGEGSFGSVYRARHKASGVIVAVKVIPNAAQDTEETAKIMQEIEILAKCDSPFIVGLRVLLKTTATAGAGRHVDCYGILLRWEHVGFN